MIKEINVSNGFENYSQRNNKISPSTSCGPTNMIQAAEYAGYNVYSIDMFPELTQPEDKLTKFTRTDPKVLEYYEIQFPNEYKAWIKEANNIKGEKEIWEVNTIKAYPPNEIHAVMNYATRLFFNNQAMTRFSTITEEVLIDNLISGLPVVCTVRFGGFGHYVTVVGFTYDEKKFKVSKNPIYIKDYIIDNTYGRFNFKTNKYDNVSGNNEHIERKHFLNMLQPLNSSKIYAHTFTRGVATI